MHNLWIIFLLVLSVCLLLWFGFSKTPPKDDDDREA